MVSDVLNAEVKFSRARFVTPDRKVDVDLDVLLHKLTKDLIELKYEATATVFQGEEKVGELDVQLMPLEGRGCFPSPEQLKERMSNPKDYFRVGVNGVEIRITGELNPETVNLKKNLQIQLSLEPASVADNFDLELGQGNHVLDLQPVEIKVIY